MEINKKLLMQGAGIASSWRTLQNMSDTLSNLESYLQQDTQKYRDNFLELLSQLLQGISTNSQTTAADFLKHIITPASEEDHELTVADCIAYATATSCFYGVTLVAIPENKHTKFILAELNKELEPTTFTILEYPEKNRLLQLAGIPDDDPNIYGVYFFNDLGQYEIDWDFIKIETHNEF